MQGCYREDLPIAERRAIGRLKLQKPKISSLHLGDKHQKRIVSYRTGLSFTKDFCWYRHEFYKSNFHHKRLPNVNIKQEKRFKRHEKKYDSQTDYQLTIKHKCLNSGGPSTSKRIEKKIANRRTANTAAAKKAEYEDWKTSARDLFYTRINEPIFEEVICPECPIVRCIRLTKGEWVWPDRKIYDRYYYPPCKCGHSYEK